MKRILITILCLSFCAFGMAQKQGSPDGVVIQGLVQDASTKTAIAYATVGVKDDALKLIVAVITDEKGNFKLENVPLGKFNIHFSLMGYQTIIKPMQIEIAQHLGTILMQPDAKLLNEISVTGEKSSISLKLDKKIFETGKDVLSQTGSATDLLNSVPSVSVNPTGGVSLRGNSNVLILINGRRSGVVEGNALEQIPADQIERVEIITNPSSRYDAAGSAGIINIILKKNKKIGINGQLRLVGGIPNETRIMPSLNFKSNKVNLFSTFGLRLSDYVGLYQTKQTVNNEGISTFLNQQQDEDRHDDARMLYVGGDYAINEDNTITAAFLKNATNDHDKTVLNYNYTTAKNLDSSLVRNGESWEKRNYNQVEFNYTKTFKKPGQKYTIDIQYDFWNSDKEWILNTKKLIPTLINAPGMRTSSIGASKDLMLQTDFVKPLDSVSTIELGLKMENRKVTSDFLAEQQQNSNWQVFEDIDNQLNYNELIGSGYVQYAGKKDLFSYQLGLRAEVTKIKIEDEIGEYASEKNYTKLFPTLNLSYQLSQSATFQGSYSKRINRPSLFMLYPFNELTDLNSRFLGNPDLNPSFADVIELAYLKNWRLFTLNPSIYYQNNKQIILNYTFRDANGIFITSPVNISKETRRGFELSTLYNPLKWLQLNLELNAFNFEQTGTYQNQNFDFSGSTLTARLGSQLKLPKKLSLQLRYNFTGAQSNAQTHTNAIHNIDVGASKNLLKDKATLLFDVTNLFNLRTFTSTTTGVNYNFMQINSPNAARYRLTFVYRLNLKENQSVRQAKSGNRN